MPVSLRHSRFVIPDLRGTEAMGRVILSLIAATALCNPGVAEEPTLASVHASPDKYLGRTFTFRAIVSQEVCKRVNSPNGDYVFGLRDFDGEQLCGADFIVDGKLNFVVPERIGKDIEAIPLPKWRDISITFTVTKRALPNADSEPGIVYATDVKDFKFLGDPFRRLQ